MATDLRDILAENLRSYRARNRLSQDELAHLCGIHRTYIGSVERGERNVTLATLELMAKSMDISVVKLLTKRAVK